MENEIRKRVCLDCKKKLNYTQFCSRNYDLNQLWLKKLWQNAMVELFCCSCFSKQFERREALYQTMFQSSELAKSTADKILMMGIANTGKSAVLKLINYGTLNLNLDLLPTKGIKRHLYALNELEYVLWDVGGAAKYRENYFKHPEKIFKKAREMLFFIDIKDKKFYKESINYLAHVFSDKVLKHFPPEFRVNIYFHKFDSIIKHSYELELRIEWLMGEIKELAIPFKYHTHLTSIYNFQEQDLNAFLNSGESCEFGDLVAKLFSS